MFMNRVHEQCPKNLTQENTESNRAKNRPSAPSAQPKASPRVPAPAQHPAQRPASCSMGSSHPGSVPIFFFSNKPNKLLKFILLILLFQFTHCKLQGLFSNMPMCYLPKHTNIHITQTTCHTHQTHTYNHSSIHMITHKTHMPCPSFVPCLS